MKLKPLAAALLACGVALPFAAMAEPGSGAKAAATDTKGALADATITTKVKAALIREQDLSAMDINVETEDGTVQLAGFVESKEQVERAKKVAEGVEGVKSVKNDLRIKNGS
jgi:hyperosmotically inducible protein